MKTKILSFFAICAIALGMGSCADSWEPKTSDTGEVALSSIGVEVSTNETVVSRAEVDLNPYIVTILNASGAIEKQWRFEEMPEIFSLPVGDYTVEVKSHEVQKAAWDEPLYVGTQQFKIEKNKITEIGTVVCKFASLKVTVVFGDDLRRVMGSDVQVRVVANDGGELVFTPDEQRAGYFEVIEGSTTIVATFTGTVNSYYEKIISPYDDIHAGEHYILNYRLRTNPLEPDPETGQIDPSQGVNVETGVTEVNQDGNVNNDEDIIDMDPDYNHEQFVEEVETDYNAASQTISIAAPAGIASVKVAVGADSNSDFTSAFAALNGADLATTDLSSFGLPAPSQVANATALTINLSKLIADAKEYEGDHTFTFTAADKEGAQSEPVTVSVKGKSSSSIEFETELSTTAAMNPADYLGKGKVTIKTPAGIKNLMLDIDTNATDPVFTGVASVLSGKDLANPDAETKAALDDLELANGDDLRNKTEVVFDISAFIPLLTFDGTHKFTITVIDNSNSSDSITLTFVVQ